MNILKGSLTESNLRQIYSSVFLIVC